MFAFIWLIDQILTIYSWCFILLVIISWLIAFGIINPHGRITWQVHRFLTQVTNPLLHPIQRIIPPIAGIDISPVIAILLLGFLRVLLVQNVA